MLPVSYCFSNIPKPMLHEGLCIHLVFSWEAVPLNGLIVFRSCLNLATPWAGACQAPLSVGFSRQARILKWVAISFSRGSSWPINWICISCIVGKLFTDQAQRLSSFSKNTISKVVAIPPLDHPLSLLPCLFFIAWITTRNYVIYL